MRRTVLELRPAGLRAARSREARRERRVRRILRRQTQALIPPPQTPDRSRLRRIQVQKFRFNKLKFKQFKFAKFGFDELVRQLSGNVTDESRGVGISRERYAVSTCVTADWNRQRPGV
jgi:hypothetical protein